MANHSEFVSLQTGAQTDSDDSTHNASPDLSDEEAYRILWIVTFIATPVISILGIMGNISSIFVLKKHGFQKCSNILLFNLAISDISFLVGASSVVKMVYEFGQVEGFNMPYPLALVMYVLYHISDIMDYAGSGVSFNIIVLITIERLIAVFLPLKFSVIVTPKRTVTAVSCLYVFWFSIFTYMRCWFKFEYTKDNPYNISVGVVKRSDTFYIHADAHVADVIQGIMVYMAPTIPLPFVVLGCVAIGIKVKLTARKRMKMTSSVQIVQTNNCSSSSRSKSKRKNHGDMSRTTRMLVSVCVVFSFTALIMALPHHLPQFMYYTAYGNAPNNTALVFYKLMNLVICVNCSCNFLIYVATNKKFRDTQKELMTSCFSNRQS